MRSLSPVKCRKLTEMDQGASGVTGRIGEGSRSQRWAQTTIRRKVILEPKQWLFRAGGNFPVAIQMTQRESDDHPMSSPCLAH